MTPEEVKEEVSRIPRHDEAGVLRIPRIHSWSDVVAILSLVSIFVGGLVWGMKLESRYDALDAKISATRSEFASAIELVRSDVHAVKADVGEIKTLLQRGVLPVTAARLDACEQRINDLEHQHQKD